MAQMANLVSYRGDLPFFLILLNKKKLFLFLYLFLRHFCQISLSFQILLPKIKLSYIKGCLFLKCFIFYKASKFKFFLQKISKSKKNNLIQTKKVNTFLPKSFLIILLQRISWYISGFHLFYYSAKNIHVFLKTTLGERLLHQIFFFFKQRGYTLFPRRFTFYIDMIKLSALFFLNKISIDFFLNMIGEIFKILQKRQHTKFFVFLKDLFKLLIKLPSLLFAKPRKLGYPLNLVQGIKFRANGRLRGKPRSNSCIFSLGRYPLQTFKSLISFSKTHVYTRYGVFGFRCWIYRICFWL